MWRDWDHRATLLIGRLRLSQMHFLSCALLSPHSMFSLLCMTTWWFWGDRGNQICQAQREQVNKYCTGILCVCMRNVLGHNFARYIHICRQFLLEIIHFCMLFSPIYQFWGYFSLIYQFWRSATTGSGEVQISKESWVSDCASLKCEFGNSTLNDELNEFLPLPYSHACWFSPLLLAL